MEKRTVIVDLSYSYENTLNSCHDLLKLQRATSGHYTYLSKRVDLRVIRLIKTEQRLLEDGINYHFFSGKKSKIWIPYHLHHFIQSLKPDVILVHGFFNPIQLLCLTLQFKVPVVIQYHGGGVPGGFTSLFQRLLSRRINNYVFTAKAQAEPFIEKNLISKRARIYEIPEGSISTKCVLREEARSVLKIDQKKLVFIWVGRLDVNKDPLTVLKGVDKILKSEDNIELLMIYQDDGLIDEVKFLINSSKNLKESVKLVGKVEHEILFKYYSAADFFVSGSHYEATGYALFEALSCGCIPIVTDIPSFRIMTDNGRNGVLWKTGDEKSLEYAISLAILKNRNKTSQQIIDFFNKELSFESIAKKQIGMFEEILKREL